MLNYQDICKKFKEAVKENQPVPEYKVDHEKNCNNEELKKEVKQRNQEWNKQNENNVEFKKVGVCEIGQFTGNELLRIFLDICNNNNNKDYNQPGNCIYLNSNDESIAALIFLYSSVLTVEVTATSNDEHQKMFIKLFNDRRVEEYRKGKFLRDKAKSLYQKFLNTKFLEFSKILDGDYILPIRKAFLRLLAQCAYRMNNLDPLRQVQSTSSQLSEEFTQIPFAACIKFAFDVDNSGVISTLLGQIPKQDSNVKVSKEERCIFALETAKELIKL